MDPIQPVNTQSKGVFLTAEWRHLVMLNYEVDPSLLLKFVPAGTELDRWNGKSFLSLVGFRFLQTKVLGMPFPLHRNFEEVNLRFYVCREQNREIKRGVVFIREIVPCWAIATIARTFYNENYIALPISHRIVSKNNGELEVDYSVRPRLCRNTKASASVSLSSRWFRSHRISRTKVIETKMTGSARPLSNYFPKKIRENPRKSVASRFPPMYHPDKC
jgi:uncharacterized protein YqjF (DUF2071 family)